MLQKLGTLNWKSPHIIVMEQHEIQPTHLQEAHLLYVCQVPQRSQRFMLGWQRKPRRQWGPKHRWKKTSD
jgi:hypothetical protein